MTALQQNARGGTTDPATGSSDDDDFVHVNDSRPLHARSRGLASSRPHVSVPSHGCPSHLAIALLTIAGPRLTRHGPARVARKAPADTSLPAGRVRLLRHLDK